MNEKELDQTEVIPEEVTLEDILADFDMDDGWTDEKDLSCDEPTVPLESISQVVIPDKEIPQKQPAEMPQPVTNDTVRLDDVSQATPSDHPPVTRDTVALEDLSQMPKENQDVTGDTVRLEDPSPAEPEQSGETTEPIPENMEPLHRDPIVFDPRARIRELKRQIIAGPETRYYELSEKGVFKYHSPCLPRRPRAGGS